MSNKSEPFEKVPPHVNAEAHRRVMEALRAMTPEEVFQHAVSVGIYHPEGGLTKEYGGSDKPARSTEDETDR